MIWILFGRDVASRLAQLRKKEVHKESTLQRGGLIPLSPLSLSTQPTMVRFVALSALIALVCGLCVLALPAAGTMPDGVYYINLPAGYLSLREADKAEFCSVILNINPGGEQVCFLYLPVHLRQT